MKNSVFTCLLMAVFLLTVAAAQQPAKIPRMGYLSSRDPASDSVRSGAVRLGLRELGYIEGQNISIEYRFADGKRERFRDLAADLVRLKVDVIVVAGGTPSVREAMKATKTIPIVMYRAVARTLSIRDSFKASLIPVGMSLALQTSRGNLAARGWNSSKKPFQKLTASRFSTIRPLRTVSSR